MHTGRKADGGFGSIRAAGRRLFGAVAKKPAPRGRLVERRLEVRAERTVSEMEKIDPTLSSVLDEAAGYAVFPERTLAPIAVRARSVGVLYAWGEPMGRLALRHRALAFPSVAHILVLRTRAALTRFMAGKLEPAEADAVVVLAPEAAASARFQNGQAMFVRDESGMRMPSATVARCVRLVGPRFVVVET